MSIDRRLEPFVPHALAALRIVAGYLFLLHGTAKLFGFPHVAMFDRLPVGRCSASPGCSRSPAGRC